MPVRLPFAIVMPVRLLLAIVMPVRLLLAIVMPVRLILAIAMPVRLRLVIVLLVRLLLRLYKCVININALQIPPYVARPTRTTRGQNRNSFIPISCNDSYKYSYFPKTLLE
jgi:hypothetical protein